jgi:hypothetical protein
MLGEKGKQIVKFMEDMDLGLTINQAALMFYPRKFAYDYARLKLKRMWEQGYIKRYTNDHSGEIIYYFDKKPSFHNNSVLNVYANFINAGYQIREFKKECEWLDGKYRSDGFIAVENNKEIRLAAIEVDHANVTNMRKYDEIYWSGELQRKYGDFPMVIILSDVERNYSSDNYTTVTLDIRCSDFQKVLA